MLIGALATVAFVPIKPFDPRPIRKRDSAAVSLHVDALQLPRSCGSTDGERRRARKSARQAMSLF
jgi:hypothetical protein